MFVQVNNLLNAVSALPIQLVNEFHLSLMPWIIPFQPSRMPPMISFHLPLTQSPMLLQIIFSQFQMPWKTPTITPRMSAMALLTVL